MTASAELGHSQTTASDPDRPVEQPNSGHWGTVKRTVQGLNCLRLPPQGILCRSAEHQEGADGGDVAK
jgi:hypothetical protein